MLGDPQDAMNIIYEARNNQKELKGGDKCGFFISFPIEYTVTTKKNWKLSGDDSRHEGETELTYFSQ